MIEGFHNWITGYFVQACVVFGAVSQFQRDHGLPLFVDVCLAGLAATNIIDRLKNDLNG